MLVMMRRNVIFFDLDGTLADSMAHIATLVTAIAVNDLGIPEPVIREKLPYLLSLPAHEAMPQLAALAGKNVAVLDEIMRRRPDDIALPLTLFPEVPAVLSALADSGYTMVLSTNSPQAGLAERLRAAGIERFFRIALGTDLATGATKGPEHIRLLAEGLGIPLSDVGGVSVLVGDQEGDMRLAKQLGMAAIGCARVNTPEALTRAGADRVVVDLTGLTDALAQLDPGV
jgi:phosphoglycolate phosphatase-like HAD superfamily hydrolase